jgi:integrase
MANIEKRLSSSGKLSYRALIRRKGYPTESATFERLTDARDWAQKTEAAMKDKRYFKSAESKKHTVANLIDRYLKRLEQHNTNRYADVKSPLHWWKEELGYCVLADLSKTLVTEKIEKLASKRVTLKDGSEKRISPARVNRYIAALSHACTIAVNEWEWLEYHPLHKVSKMKEPRGRVRFLDDDERKRLVTACQQSKCPCLYTVVILALSTGARFSEIMNLTWPDVDLNRKAITLHETKNNERRVLPLAGHALELIKGHKKVQHIDSDLVFPSPHNPKQPYKIRAAWDTAIEKAKLEDFRFHDLRHSAASYLAMGGASLAEIAEVLGHKTLSMVKRYAHLSEAHTHGVVTRMNERIFGNEQ